MLLRFVSESVEKRLHASPASQLPAPDVGPRHRGIRIGQVFGPSLIELRRLFLSEHKFFLTFCVGKASQRAIASSARSPDGSFRSCESVLGSIA
jgi:hypothetical protein